MILAWFALVVVARYPFWAYGSSPPICATRRTSTVTCTWAPTGTRRSAATPAGLPRAAEHRRRAQSVQTARRPSSGFILAIPVVIIFYAMQIVAELGAFIAWFVIVVLGRQPRGLQDMIALGLSYQQRATTYFALVTEDWPPFVDDHQRSRSKRRRPSGRSPPRRRRRAPRRGRRARAPRRRGARARSRAAAGRARAGGRRTAPPVADENDDEERPPGPFGPSSTQ